MTNQPGPAMWMVSSIAMFLYLYLSVRRPMENALTRRSAWYEPPKWKERFKESVFSNPRRYCQI